MFAPRPQIDEEEEGLRKSKRRKMRPLEVHCICPPHVCVNM